MNLKDKLEDREELIELLVKENRMYEHRLDAIKRILKDEKDEKKLEHIKQILESKIKY